MTDKTELQNDTNEEVSGAEINDNNHKDEVEEQDIFEHRFHELMDIFGEQCEKHGIEVAIAMAVYPEPDGVSAEEAERFTQPMVFFRGSILESMSLSAEVLRNFKTTIAQSLDTDPR